VNECTTDAAGLTTFRQKLVARRGNCDPVTIMELPAVGPTPDPLVPVLGVGLCRQYGDFRTGNGSLLFGRFQRLAALPDASAIVFEVTSKLSSLPSATPALPEEGIFFARPDGTGRRRLGDASRVRLSTAVPDPASPRGVSYVGSDNVAFGVSPNSKLIAFVDLIADPAGELTRQLFVLDINSTERRQITRLPPTPIGSMETCCPRFADDRTVVFFDGSSGSRARVKTDGSGLEALSTEALPGSRILPQFEVFRGATSSVLTVSLPAVMPAKTYPGGEVVNEIFTLNGSAFLQLTNFRYPDTRAFAFGRGRAFFMASANPLGTNPTENCQLFSINPRHGQLRQLTRFHDEERMNAGCGGVVAGAACTITSGGSQDRETGFIGFASQCDLFGRNPYGEQIFSIRPDGSGLRQITSFRGRELLPDGSVHVELSGPVIQAGNQ
jgi:hypothetical protein